MAKKGRVPESVLGEGSWPKADVKVINVLSVPKAGTSCINKDYKNNK